MANYLVDSTDLTSVADAIRTKGGTSAALEFPDGFVDAIDDIETGGGGDTNPTAPENDVIFIDYDGTIRYSYTAAEFLALTELPANPTHDGLTAQGWNWTLADAQDYVQSYGGLCIGQNYITTSGDTEVDLVLVPGVTDGIISLCINGTVEIDFGDGSTPERVTGTSLTTKVHTQHDWPAGGGAFTYKISLVSGSYNLAGQGYGKGSCSCLYWGGIEKDRANAPYCTCIRRVRIGTISGFYDAAFYNLWELESVTIPSGRFTAFPNYSFSNDYTLQAIVFPPADSLSLAASYIANGTAMHYTCFAKNTRNNAAGPGGFTDMHQLRRVYIPPTVTTASGGYGNCYSLSQVFIPNGVTQTSSSAFSNCYSLQSITIPASVTTIAANTFQNCYELEEVHLKPTTPPTLSSTNAFSGVPSDCVLYVPVGTLSDYQAATNWSTYSAQMQEETV